MTPRVITDYEIRMIREQADDATLVDMLNQLLAFRKHARQVIGAHDYRFTPNAAMFDLHMLVRASGCHWYACGEAAQTMRFQRNVREVSHLCRQHADEGEEQQLWDLTHPMNNYWREQDEADRVRDRLHETEGER